MRISDWSSDVCSSDLGFPSENVYCVGLAILSLERPANVRILDFSRELIRDEPPRYGWAKFPIGTAAPVTPRWEPAGRWRSEEHTSELQSLMRISYAVVCLTKKKNNAHNMNKLYK